MKTGFLVFSLVTVCLLLPTFGGHCAESVETWNITGRSPISDSSLPMLWGTTLVWQAKGGLSGATSGDRDWEIFLYDLLSQVMIQITDDDSNDFSPQTDGDYVAWQKHHKRQGTQIFLYSIQGGSPDGGSLISSTEKMENYEPKIVDARVVWVAQRIADSYEPGRIMLYDAENQSGPVAISESGIDCSNPLIDQQQVSWMQDFNDGTKALYLYDLMSDSPVGYPAPDSFKWSKSPCVDGQQKVLARHDGTDREILLYTRSDGYVQITDNDMTDTSPVISQNYVAWKADNNIYVSEIARFIRVHMPGTRGSDSWATGFRALWSELSGVDYYLLDVATDPDFQNYVAGFRAINVGNTTEYVVQGLNPETTYYYRIHAVVNGSTTDYSKSITVSLGKAGVTKSGTRALPFVYKLLLK